MEAVLYIGHGSRVKEANEQAAFFVRKLMKRVNVPIQEFAFLELSQPTIAQGFERCVMQGATIIYVLPILLLTAQHAKIDIPIELSILKERFPNVDVHFGHPIGVDESMMEVIQDRIKETKVLPNEECGVLLVGRGSSDLDVKKDLTSIAEMLEKRTVFKHVDVCFLAASQPSFQEGLEKVIQSKNQKVYVIPYLFFTGMLMKKIERTIKNINTSNCPELILCRSLGYHPIMETIFQEQLDTMMK